MGDLIGESIEGKLYYISYNYFVKVRNSNLDKLKKYEVLANMYRLNVLYMVANAGSGHLGSSFSSMEIITLLLSDIFEFEKDSNILAPVFFSSKGHDAPALYSVLLGLGKLDFELLHKLRRLDGLPGHPDIKTPGIVTNTGSLGMGVSKAKGMIFADRIKNISRRYYVLTGDGELQEGQFWESLISASNYFMHELTVIVDHNKLQSDNLVSTVSDLGNLEDKFKSFGWEVYRCNGNNLVELNDCYSESNKFSTKPKVIIADTIKGKGVSFMEHTSNDSDVEYYKFHSGAPTEENYSKSSSELMNKILIQFNQNQLGTLIFTDLLRPKLTIQKQTNTQKLINAYSETLIHEAKKNSNIVVLDADLILDTGLIPFKNKFPKRFIECGIAEQDMVSIAGGLALNGLLPIVHSFSCFLSSRPNEQIYNNSTEGKKIIYVGSLAGLLPAGPGHSHQAVRDISAVASCPGLVVCEPSCEEEMKELLSWSINECEMSVYIRTVSLPTQIDFKWDKAQFHFGMGSFLKKGKDILIIAYGPIFLNIALKVAENFELNNDIKVSVLNFPWLNNFNKEWILENISNYNLVVTIDNHYLDGGFGEKFSSVLNELNINSKFLKIGLNEIPVSGQPAEVLNYHDLDEKGIYRLINSKINF